jgi:hypothetical protein
VVVVVEVAVVVIMMTMMMRARGVFQDACLPLAEIRGGIRQRLPRQRLRLAIQQKKISWNGVHSVT